MEEQMIPWRNLPPAATSAFVKMLGLAARARKLAIGAPLARDAMRTKRAQCAVLAIDASENTKKRISDTAAYYHIPLYEVALSSGELGHAVGKSGAVAALGVLDESFASALQGIYNKFSEHTDSFRDDPLEV